MLKTFKFLFLSSVEAIMSTTEDIVESDMEGSSGDLFSLSMKLLWYYQKMKPGVLTESGFNVCKLLLMPGNVTEETLDNILDILILEQTDTRMWLEKVKFQLIIVISRRPTMNISN